jgi:hypothetical protein
LPAAAVASMRRNNPGSARTGIVLPDRQTAE